MTLAFRCRECGDFDTGVDAITACPTCGAAVTTYRCGVPTKEIGFPQVKTPFKRRYSPAHGVKLETWDQYHRMNKRMGLVDTGVKMHPDDMPARQTESPVKIEEITDAARAGLRDGTHGRIVVGK